MLNQLMKFFLLGTLMSLAATLGIAQRQANNWYYGQKTGLRFGINCQPIALFDSPMSADYGSAVMSDGQTGELLFYTDSYQVWDRYHHRMPNGQFNYYAGRGALTQGSLFVPVPGHKQPVLFFSPTRN